MVDELVARPDNVGAEPQDKAGCKTQIHLGVRPVVSKLSISKDYGEGGRDCHRNCHYQLRVDALAPGVREKDERVCDND